MSKGTYQINNFSKGKIIFCRGVSFKVLEKWFLL